MIDSTQRPRDSIALYTVTVLFTVLPRRVQHGTSQRTHNITSTEHEKTNTLTHTHTHTHSFTTEELNWLLKIIINLSRELPAARLNSIPPREYASQFWCSPSTVPHPELTSRDVSCDRISSIFSAPTHRKTPQFGDVLRYLHVRLLRLDLTISNRYWSHQDKIPKSVRQIECSNVSLSLPRTIFFVFRPVEARVPSNRDERRIFSQENAWCRVLMSILFTSTSTVPNSYTLRLVDFLAAHITGKCTRDHVRAAWFAFQAVDGRDEKQYVP